MVKSILNACVLGICVLALVFLKVDAFAQTLEESKGVFVPTDSRSTHKLRPGSDLSIDHFFEIAGNELGISEDDKFELIQQETDKWEITHYRFRQYHKGLRIDGTTLVLHEKEGRITSTSGQVIANLELDLSPAITPLQAMEQALKHGIAHQHGDKSQSEAELVIKVVRDNEGNFSPHLCYRTLIEANENHGLFKIYIKASNGEVFLKESKSCQGSGDTHGTAETYHYGTQNIIIDSIDTDSFVLIDKTRCDSIITVDNKYQTESNIYNTENISSDNQNFDSTSAAYLYGAYDAHWGAEKYYDFLHSEFGRYSYDNANGPIRMHVNTNMYNYSGLATGSSSSNYRIFFAYYSSSSSGPVPILWLTGHEITHFMTYETSDMVYSKEPGALNEGFSDIFGSWLSYNALTSGFTWGSDFLGTSSSWPNTYKGTNWQFETNASDQYGVHKNDAILNRWFYLFNQGGSGTNDNGHSYSVSGMGWAKSMNVAYNTLCYYLTESSEYIDARDATLQCIEDIYGTCSSELESAAEAWYAVGVGLSYTSPTSTALSGSYTIGGSSPDYSTFTAAVSDLHTYGICGPVEFVVRNGVYNEQITINHIHVGSSQNTITFRSQSMDSTKVTLTYNTSSTNNFVIKLNGADNVVFKQISIRTDLNGNDGPTGRCVEITNDANFNRFENCRFLGVYTTSSTSTDLALVYSPAYNDDENQFINNIFQFGSYGLYMYGSTYSDPKEQRTYVYHNNFANQYACGIYLNNQEDCVVEENEIHTYHAYAWYKGIYCLRAKDDLLITKNWIYGQRGGYGMWLFNCYGNAEFQLVSNNFVQVGGSSSSSSSGIEIYNSSKIHLYFNTVNQTSTKTSDKAFWLNGLNSQIHVKNNIFANKGAGYAIFAHYGSSSGFSSCDYNNLYTAGSYLGNYGSYNISTLSSWTSWTGLDVNSKSISPTFTSTTDLHISNFGLKGAGDYSILVTDDIDGQTRNSNPTIGADEIFLKYLGPGGFGHVVAENVSTKIDGQAEEFTIDIFPNPSQGLLNLSFEGSIDDDMSVSLISLEGKQFLLGCYNSKQMTRLQIDLSSYNLKNGEYLLLMEAGGKKYTYSVILQNQN